MAGFLDNTKEDTLNEIFPNNEDYIARLSRVASCLTGGAFSKKVLDFVSNGGLPITISKLLTGSPETWTFDVVHGRSGTIATAVDGATIDAASTISLEYTLVSSPAASDWKQYTDGSFTGTEVDKIIEFVGLQNRIVWTPNAGEDLNVMVAL